jgi:hypothetical protein
MTPPPTKRPQPSPSLSRAQRASNARPFTRTMQGTCGGRDPTGAARRGAYRNGAARTDRRGGGRPAGLPSTALLGRPPAQKPLQARNACNRQAPLRWPWKCGPGPARTDPERREGHGPGRAGPRWAPGRCRPARRSGTAGPPQRHRRPTLSAVASRQQRGGLTSPSSVRPSESPPPPPQPPPPPPPQPQPAS